MFVRWRAVLLGVLAMIGAGGAGAAPIGLMFESDADVGPGSELAIASYPSFEDVIAGTNFTSQFSQINVSPGYGTRGLTWDGGRFLMMFESDADAAPGSELAFVSYPTYDDLIAGTNFTSAFSQINVSPGFTTRGLTWDGSRFLLAFESDADAAPGSELAFVSYPTYDDLIAGTNFTSQFSQINVSPGYSTTGLNWDATGYTLMFESDADAAPGSELAFVTYPTFEYLLAGTNFTSQFSQINVSPGYSTTDFFSFPTAEPPVIPLPAGIWLMAGGLAAFAAVRRRTDLAHPA